MAMLSGEGWGVHNKGGERGVFSVASVPLAHISDVGDPQLKENAQVGRGRVAAQEALSIQKTGQLPTHLTGENRPLHMCLARTDQACSNVYTLVQTQNTLRHTHTHTHTHPW